MYTYQCQYQYQNGSQIWKVEADSGGRTGVKETIFYKSKSGLQTAKAGSHQNMEEKAEQNLHCIMKETETIW